MFVKQSYDEKTDVYRFEYFLFLFFVIIFLHDCFLNFSFGILLWEIAPPFAELQPLEIVNFVVPLIPIDCPLPVVDLIEQHVVIDNDYQLLVDVIEEQSLQHGLWFIQPLRNFNTLKQTTDEKKKRRVFSSQQE
jgi:hypothetical protein